MSHGVDPTGRLPAAFLASDTSSFVEFLGRHAPDALRAVTPPSGTAGTPDVPHATTIVALACTDGVIMAGDRRATAGSVIASRDIVKVHPADDHSAIGIAGAAGIGLEMIRLFQVELEHFEKLEGTTLSLEGKATRLAAMVRGNLGMALQGLAAVPLFAGWDLATGRGRIYSFDATGGRYTESDHHSIGSGSYFARGSMKKRWRPDLTTAEAPTVAIEALFDAADDDSATGGPDIVRRIWPVVAVVDAAGYRELPEDALEALVEDLVGRRRGGDAPGGGAVPDVGGTRS